MNLFFSKKKLSHSDIIEIVYHVLFWSLIAYFFVNNSILRPGVSVWKELISIALIILACYLNYFRLYPLFFKKKKFIYFIILIFLMLFTTALEISLVLKDIRNCYQNAPSEFLNPIIRNTCVYVFFRNLTFISIAVLYKFYEEAVRVNYLEKEQCRLKEQMQQVEINNLRTKIAPHFVFNNLNRIRADIAKYPEKAEDKVVAVARLLRTFFDDSSQQFISILEEIQFIKDLINLENDYRYKNLDVQFSYDNLSGSEEVVPLLFQTFISNAFKFVHTENGFIHIRLKKENNVLLFCCKNSIASEKLPTMVSTGSGIKDTQKRLDLLYPDKYKLSISETETVFNVELKLWLNDERK